MEAKLQPTESSCTPPIEGKCSDLTEDDIDFIIRHIGSDLQQLARALKLCETDQDDLNLCKESLKERAYRAVHLWRRNNGCDATKEAMVKALKSIDRSDIANEISKCISTPNEAYKKMEPADLRNLQERLKDRYSSLCVPQPPGIKVHFPIDEIFTLQEMEIFHNRKKIMEIKGPIQLEHIFKQVNGAGKILVEGNAGFGKTTLATKLASDWAKETKYISSLYSLVLLIPLRDIKEQHLEDVIVGVINRAIQSNVLVKEELKDFLDKNKTLLLLDGCDELTPAAIKRLKDLLNSGMLASCCILATSRKGIFTCKDANEYSGAALLFEDENTSKCEDWDTRVVLKGFSKEQRHAYLLQHFNIDTNALEPDMKKWVSDGTEDLFRSPMLIFWLGWMIQSKKILNIATRTQFYKAVFNFILQETTIRERIINKNDQFDIFTSSSDATKSFAREMNQFGALALERLTQHDLSFTERDLQHLSTSTLLKSDMMVKCKPVTTIKEETCYQPMHKTFLEFLAAFSVCNSVHDDPKSVKCFRIKIRSLVKKGLLPCEQSVFFPFLAGLMKDKACWLFDGLSRWAAIFHACTPELLAILVELTTVNGAIIRSLLKYVPSHYKVERLNGIPESYYSSECHKNLFQSTLESISVMHCDTAALKQLLPVARLKVLFLKPSRNFSCSANELVEQTSCNDLICDITEDMDATIWKSYLSCYNAIVPDRRHLHVNQGLSSTCTMILNQMTQGNWRDLSFQRVRIDERSLSNENLELLAGLVRKKSITRGIVLHIDVNDKLEADLISQLWEEVVLSQIDEFVVLSRSNLCPVFDFAWIADGRRTAPFKTLYLSTHFTVKLANSESKSVNSIRDLTLLDHSYGLHSFQSEISSFELAKNDMADLLQSTRDLKFFECRSNLFCFVLSKNLSVFSSLNELYLVVDEEFWLPASSCSQAHFPSLRALTLHVVFDGVPSSLTKFLSAILRSRQLQTLKLVINTNSIFHSWMNFLSATTQKLFDCLQLVWAPNNEKELSRGSLSCVKRFLVQNQLKSLLLVDLSDRNFVFHHRVLTSMFPEEEFDIKCELSGHNDQDDVPVQDRLVCHFLYNYRLRVTSRLAKPSFKTQ